MKFGIAWLQRHNIIEQGGGKSSLQDSGGTILGIDSLLGISAKGGIDGRVTKMVKNLVGLI